MVPLSWYLIFAALLFCVGLYGVLARRNAVAVLMSIELMLNAVNINLLAFWRYLYTGPDAQVFIAIVLAAAAAEAVVGLALIISAYRQNRTVIPNELNLMKG
jgi:NADH:ubiquinone oxidoreductase subunit K